MAAKNYENRSTLAHAVMIINQVSFLCHSVYSAGIMYYTDLLLVSQYMRNDNQCCR